jgi:hypothetical protein
MMALTVFGAVLATGVGWGIGEAKASPETNYLSDLTDAGIVIYDTSQAISTGYAICEAFNTVNGEVVAENLYTHTSYADIPNRAAAAAWVLAAGLNLCPWHFHPERVQAAIPGYVA